ncbi:MAG: MBL fold metallo-hydrolase [Candidatus Hodarchaeota archaeon]
MIIRKLIVGPLGTNCYIFGSEDTNEVVIIDPGGNAENIIQNVKELNGKPIAVLLTHGHFDHTFKVGKILRFFQIPLMYCEKEYTSRVYTQRKADKWLAEGDTLKIGDIHLKILETPGHSPGSLCYYSNDVKEYKKRKIDGIIFTGDLIFKRSIGRSDIHGGNQNLLFQSIKNKIMYNSIITDNFLIFPGHMSSTSVGEERALNLFKKYFL